VYDISKEWATSRELDFSVTALCMSSSCHQPETNSCFHDDLSSLVLNIVQSERLQRETVKVALSVALSRHFSKCQDGNDGKSCMAFSIATRQALLAGFQESPAIEHYRKCREEATQHPRHCLCGMVRRFLNEMKQAEKPLSLEILCICALPPNIVAAPFPRSSFPRSRENARGGGKDSTHVEALFAISRGLPSNLMQVLLSWM
jgi:hypothetical protein